MFSPTEAILRSHWPVIGNTARTIVRLAAQTTEYIANVVLWLDTCKESAIPVVEDTLDDRCAYIE